MAVKRSGEILERTVSLLRIAARVLSWTHGVARTDWRSVILVYLEVESSRMVYFEIGGRAAAWSAKETTDLSNDYAALDPLDHTVSKYNPTPATGMTGVFRVPPNNYPFYGEEEKYAPVVQADGGQLSEWEPMYQPSTEQAEKDREEAFERGIPHGFVAAGDKYADLPTIELMIVSERHDASEYGSCVDAEGRHSGGPFALQVSPKMRIWDLRKLIYKGGGILPALQKLSYAGKAMNDANRTLEHYGVAYWHKKFPHWAIKITV